VVFEVLVVGGLTHLGPTFAVITSRSLGSAAHARSLGGGAGPPIDGAGVVDEHGWSAQMRVQEVAYQVACCTGFGNEGHERIDVLLPGPRHAVHFAVGFFGVFDELECVDVEHPVTITQAQIINGGHTIRQVSVRVGQPAFRAELVRKFGSICAFSGPAPAEALEACHLYSYAEIGRHDIEGGLLLRRDLHRLFDQGLLAVNRDGTIDVDDSLQPYDLYFRLHGQQLQVNLTARQRDWLALHWAEWR